MVTIQVTLFSTNGYKPMSCLIDIESITYYQEHKKQVQNEAIQKICGRRSMGTYELKKYGYSKVKVREYDKERIDRENKERYEKIKEERGWK